MGNVPKWDTPNYTPTRDDAIQTTETVVIRTEDALDVRDRRYSLSAACLRALLPSMRFQTGDLERLFAGSGECLQLTGGVFECRGSRVIASAMRITELDFNCGVQIRSPVEPWRLQVLLVRPAPGSRVLVNAREFTNRSCVVVSGDELAMNILGAASILWLDIDRRALKEGDCADAFAPVKCMPDLSAAERATLVTYAIDRFADERAGRFAAIDDVAIDTAVKRVAHSLLGRARSTVESRADANRERLVRETLGLMWARIEEPPTLREICTAAKCSVRTLIYAFNATFGMSPMKYFKIQRLNAAHQKLQSAASGAHVFDIAADFGFWHLGHFGADYKALFGTTPRMTSPAASLPRRSVSDSARGALNSISTFVSAMAHEGLRNQR